MLNDFIFLIGLLRKVRNLSVQYGQNETVISWEAPFTLTGLDIRYNVTISNQSYNQSIVLLNEDRVSVSTKASFVSCLTYNFTVQPWNDIGPGASNNIVEWFPGG